MPARTTVLVCLTALAAILAVVPTLPAQTLTTLHDFTSGGDGNFPTAGLTMDDAGNFYGTTAGGGHASAYYCGYGCGTVFKLSRAGPSWVLTPVYSFTGGDDGTTPEARVVFGPDGLLYGTNTGSNIFGSVGDATVFRLKLPASTCKTALCTAEETVLYRFTGPMDGSGPGWGDLVFDRAGGCSYDAGNCLIIAR